MVESFVSKYIHSTGGGVMMADFKQGQLKKNTKQINNSLLSMYVKADNSDILATIGLIKLVNCIN